METPQMLNERMNDMPNPILDHATYNASTAIVPGMVAAVTNEGAPLQRLMAHLGYTGKRDIYGENDQVTGAEDLEATGFQRLYTLGNDGQLKPYTPASWAEAVRFMDAGNVLMVPQESTGKMFCLSAQANENGGFDYFAMNEENLRAARAAQEKLPPRPTRLQRVGDFFMKLFGSRNQACKAYDEAQPARDAFSPVDKVGAAMAAKERTEAQHVDAARVAREKEAARQQRKREAERKAARETAQKRDQAAGMKNWKDMPRICEYAGVLNYANNELKSAYHGKASKMGQLYSRVVAAAYVMAEKKDLTIEQLMDVAAGKPAGMGPEEAKLCQQKIDGLTDQMQSRTLPPEVYETASQRMSEMFLQCGDYLKPASITMALALSEGLYYTSDCCKPRPSSPLDYKDQLRDNARSIASLVEYAVAGQQCLEKLAFPSTYQPVNEDTPTMTPLFTLKYYGNPGDHSVSATMTTPHDLYRPEYACMGMAAKATLEMLAEKPAAERLRESTAPKDSPESVVYEKIYDDVVWHYGRLYDTPVFKESRTGDPEKDMTATLKNLKGGMNSPMMRALLDVASKGTERRPNAVKDKALANALSERLNRSQPKREQPQKKASNAIVK